MEPFTGGGSVGFCDRYRCHIAKQYGKGFSLPNGIVRGRDDYFYVPSTITGDILIYTLDNKKMLDQITYAEAPYGIDNLSMDKDGEFWAATFPKLHKWIESASSPMDVKVPSTIYRIKSNGWRKVKENGRHVSTKMYEAEKFMEDGDGSYFGGATTVVHDGRNKRFFMGGAVSPYITICQAQ